jgi:hypothetical protein
MAASARNIIVIATGRISASRVRPIYTILLVVTVL